MVLRGLRSSAGRHGFAAAAAAAAGIFAGGRVPDEAAIDLACRARGPAPAAGGPVDLAVCDGLAGGGVRVG